MGSLEKALSKLQAGKRLRFDEGILIADSFFGRGRKCGSHNVYSLPWKGDLLNLQADSENKVKKYQQKQLKVYVDKVQKGQRNGS